MRAQMKPSGMQRLHLKSVPSFTHDDTYVKSESGITRHAKAHFKCTLACTSTDADELPDGPLRVCGSAVQWNSPPC